MPTTANLAGNAGKQQVLQFIEPPISALEKYVQDLKNSSKSKTKSAQTKIKEYETEIKRKAHAAKLGAKKLEQTNLDHLYFIGSTDGWSKLAFNSALFFESDIKTRLKLPNRFHLKPDLDNYAISPSGVISLHLDDGFIAELAELNIIKDDKFEYHPDITAFKLPWQYKAEDIEKIVSTINQDQAKANELVKPKNLVPELYTALVDLNTMVYQNCRRLPDQFARDTIGKDLYEKSSAALSRYIETANGDLPCEEGLLRVLKNLVYIKHTMCGVNYLKIITTKHAIRIESQIILAERIAKKFLNGVKKNETK